MPNAFENAPVKKVYCGFVDVLGFGAATLKDHQDAVEVYERFLEHFEMVASHLKPEHGKMSVYSDAFIIVSEYLGYVIQAAFSLSWWMLMENFLVRGGIAYGSHVEVQKGDTMLIVSAALTRAVQLEKSVKRPCVVIDDDIDLPDALWFESRIPAPMVHYFDGLRIVTPFGMMWFRTAGQRARRLLKMYPEHAEKYKWFLRLYDAVNRRELLAPPDIIQRYNVTRPESEEPVFPEDVEVDRDLLR